MMIKSELRYNIVLIRFVLIFLGIVSIITLVTFTGNVNWKTYISLLLPFILIGFNLYNILNFKEIKIEDGTIEVNYRFRKKIHTYRLKQIKSYRRVFKDLNTDFDISPVGQTPILLKVRFSDNRSIIISSAQNKNIVRIEEKIKSTCKVKTRLKINEYPDIYYFILKKDTQYIFRPSFS